MKVILKLQNKPGALVNVLGQMDIQELKYIASFPVRGQPGIKNFNVEGEGINIIAECEVVTEFPATQSH